MLSIALLSAAVAKLSALISLHGQICLTRLQAQLQLARDVNLKEQATEYGTVS